MLHHFRMAVQSTQNAAAVCLIVLDIVLDKASGLVAELVVCQNRPDQSE
jgi:hypothetical protein